MVGKNTLVPVISLVLAMILWASSFVALKLAFEAYDPMVVIFGRMAVGSLASLVFFRAMKGNVWRKGDLKYLAFMILCEPCLYFLFEAKALFQMKFYALVLWRLHGRIPNLLQLVYLGNSEIVRYVPDEHDLRALERNIQAVWAAIVRAAETGDWRPSTSALCTWCDFRDLCPEFGGTPPPLPPNAALIALDPNVSGEVDPGDD